MHPLKTYLVDEKLTAEEFVKRLNKELPKRSRTTPGYISQIIIGHRWPSRVLAFAISNATNGDVSVEQLLSFQPTQAA